MFKKRKKGFSLVEVVVSMGVIMIVLTVLTQANSILIQAQGDTNNLRSAMLEYDYALQTIIREVKSAYAVHIVEENTIRLYKIDGSHKELSIMYKGVYLNGERIVDINSGYFEDQGNAVRFNLDIRDAGVLELTLNKPDKDYKDLLV